MEMMNNNDNDNNGINKINKLVFIIFNLLNINIKKKFYFKYRFFICFFIFIKISYFFIYSSLS